MALTKNVTSNTGIEVESAYIKVDEYSCGKNNTVNARVRAYVSREFEQEGKSFIEGAEDIIQIIGDYSDNALNMKKQIYNHIKTLEKYSDAIDVLE
ncbi:hypothetical protein MHB77_29455 [Paenibacillus sp. FSL K6-3166]|uniref:hypothetical protein n=1 Tax=unclassified Paenibacillus TaxID=185978 RepID=UPI000BA03077|nr:hypothetical protein [Paenibacillus sp. VTT E-133291]OZQ95853.1 hypothetical protein CA598_08470 [Paenibacillus sp. VTT E-133291]